MYKILFIFIISVLSTPIFASQNDNTHYCSKPILPKRLNDNRDINILNNTIKNYRTCINIFIEQEKLKNTPNIETIDNAINDWNNFSKSLKNIKNNNFQAGIYSDGTNFVGGVSKSVLKF